MTGSKYCKCFALEDPLVFMEYRYACWRRQYESASCNSFVMSTCYPAMFCQRCKILRATELKLEKSGEVGLHWEGELFCQQSRETQPDPAASQTNPISNSENLDIISKAQIKQIRTSFDAPPTTTEDYACMFAAPLLWTKLSTANIPVGWNSLIRVQTNARSNAFNKSKRRIHTRVPAASVLFNIFLAVACCLHWLFCVTQLLKACK